MSKWYESIARGALIGSAAVVIAHYLTGGTF